MLRIIIAVLMTAFVSTSVFAAEKLNFSKAKNLLDHREDIEACFNQDSRPDFNENYKICPFPIGNGLEVAALIDVKKRIVYETGLIAVAEFAFSKNNNTITVNSALNCADKTTEGNIQEVLVLKKMRFTSLQTKSCK